MKKLTFVATLAMFSFNVNSQLNWQKGGNANTPVGALPTLGTNYNDPLNFLTNSVQRATILGGTGGVNQGFMGLGNNLTGFAPADRLHLNHTSSSNVRLRFTYTGLPNALGSTIGINNTGQFVLNQFENQSMLFDMSGGTSTIPDNKLEIFADDLDKIAAFI